MSNELGLVSIQPPVSYQECLSRKLSNAAWQRGVGTFVCEGVPYSYTTGKIFADKIIALATRLFEDNPDTYQATGFHLYEFGAGVGMLAYQVLNRLQETNPTLYSCLTYHISDYSEAMIEEAQRFGICDAHQDRVSYDVLDFCQCSFPEDAPAHLVLMVNLIDSLDNRQIVVKDGVIYEQCHETFIPSDAKVLNAGFLPPDYLEGPLLTSFLNNPHLKKAVHLLPFFKDLLQPALSLVPLRESPGISDEECQTIEQCVNQLGIDHDYHFNFSQVGYQGVQHILTEGKDTALLVYDFGVTHLTNTYSLLESYGLIECASIPFSLYATIASSSESDAHLTQFPGNMPQALLMTKGSAKGLGDTFDALFQDPGYRNTTDFQSSLRPLRRDVSLPTDEVEKTFESLSDLEQDDFSIQIELAFIYYVRGEYDKTESLAKRSLTDYAPIAYYSYYLLGLVAMARGQHEDAIPLFLKAKEICPFDPDVELNLCHSYYKLKDYPQYLDHAKQATRHLSGDSFWNYLVNIALVSLKQKDVKLGMKVLRWLEAHPQDMDPMLYERVTSVLNHLTS